MRLSERKIVLVVRATRLDGLRKRFNTTSQAQFYVEHMNQDFGDYLTEDEHYKQQQIRVEHLLTGLGRVHTLQREHLPNFLFGPEDIVVVLGQDGLVANTLKYLEHQPVVGVNPDPKRWEGVLLPFQVNDLTRLIPEVLEQKRPTQLISMAQAYLNNGQTLLGVNDIFIGPKTHTSSRYVLAWAGHSESQSSSGVIVSTGLGSTGWFRSIVTGAMGISNQLQVKTQKGSFKSHKHKAEGAESTPPNPIPQVPWDAGYLYFSVREPWPSKYSSAETTFGQITVEQPLKLISQMPENGVIFSDGIESDFLEFNAGSEVEIRIADKKARLVQ
ncbi:MAG: sugar kinase [Acidobacteria bacterium]|nr:sugar kinase [Acidobacteriota bacterium]MCB9398334.1 sugar kinase [Acidobacteriota bacterium]